MDKFDRKYSLTVDIKDGTSITVELPFTIEFDITRHTLSSANCCQIRVYNLSSVNRNLIRLDPFSYKQFLKVTLKAGYGNNLATIFSGNVSQAWSVREGTNFITQMECYDGGFSYVNAQTNLTFPAGYLYRDIIIALIKSLPDITFGAVGDYPGALARANTYTGSTIDNLNDLTGGGFFIDNGKGYALGTNEAVRSIGPTTLINASTGLLGTPTLEQQKMHFDMIFEPSLNVGQIADVQSATVNNYNGIFKITGIKHRGMISGAVCGTVITTAEMLNVNPLKKVNSY